MHASDQSKFQFLSAGALASLRIIEKSSYTITPDQSPADPVPACGETIYRRKALDNEGLEAVDVILETSQAAREAKQQRPFCDSIHDRGQITGNNEGKEVKSVAKENERLRM